MEKLGELMHLLVTIFLWNIASLMVSPAITDVTMAALCPYKDECSFAIYLTGFQQSIIGLGTAVMMPLIGNLSDVYGRKTLLTLPMTFSIIPLVIIGYSRRRNYYYAYYVFNTLAKMIGDGSIQCLAFAYVADKTLEENRIAAYGILSGVTCAAIFCGTLAARFLSAALTFQVAALVTIVAVVYMRIFLKESKSTNFDALTQPILKNIHDDDNDDDDGSQLDCETSTNLKVFKKIPSPSDILFLLRSSATFTQAAIVAFFSSLSDGGIQSSLAYFYKAQFQFKKNQYADLNLIVNLAGAISQLLFMPMLAPVIGEERLLSIGLFSALLCMLLNSIAWSSWVPYGVAPLSVLAFFAGPSLTSVVSKQVGANEQGMAQGCILATMSIANIISPLIFSPLTALFLSDGAPFYFPGFSLMCIGLACMIAFISSLMIRPVVSPGSKEKSSNGNCTE